MRSTRPTANSSGSQLPPWGLPYSATMPGREHSPVSARQSTAPEALHAQRLRFDAHDLLGDLVAVGELGQAAFDAQSQPDRNPRVPTRRLERHEQLRGRLLTQIQDQGAVFRRAESAADRSGREQPRPYAVSGLFSTPTASG